VSRLREWWRWRRVVRARRDEEFRLYRLSVTTQDPEDLKAWHELCKENHALGIWG
jgi:hypothetical protein